MITVGYYCDECRMKYVRHKCKDGLPCGHPIEEAVFVECQHFAKSGESVRLSWGKPTEEYKTEFTFLLWVSSVRGRGNEETRALWYHRVSFQVRGAPEPSEMTVGEWLHTQPSKVIRAFTSRWDSFDSPPTWRWLETLTDEALRSFAE